MGLDNDSDSSCNNCNNTLNETETDDPCHYEPQEYLIERFILITIFGTCISTIGFCHNCLLVHVLTRSALIRTHVFYLCILAVCDIVAEISYILMMSTQMLFDFAENVALYRLWHNYVRWVYCLTHIALTVSVYMIVSASAERFLSTLKWVKHRTCTGRDRWLVAFGVFCFSLLSKGTIFWEVEVVYNENCSGFGSYSVQPSALARDPTYRTGYALWFRHLVHVFVPFCLLLLLNGSILLHLKRNPMEMHSALISLTLGDLARQRKKGIRAATLMLGAIVTTYLISNLLNVIISIWEHIDKRSLNNLFDGKFYTFATDMISLLTIITGCIRLPIYCACNKQLRQEVFRLTNKWRQGGRVIRDSCKRLFVKARENNNDSNFTNLCENRNNTHNAVVYSRAMDQEIEEQKILNGAHEQQALINECPEITIMTSSIVV